MSNTQTANQVTWSDVMAEKLVPLNNGLGSWDGFLFGDFTEVGQECLANADHLSLADALTRGGADFNVGKYPMQVETPGGKLIVPDRFVTVREDTWQPLGPVGAGYQVVQTAKAMAVAEAVDISAGSDGMGFIGFTMLDNGARMAAIYALQPLDIGKDEQVLPVILIWTSHDGTKAVELTFVPIRLACFNGNMWHVQGQSSVYKVKHTATADARLATAAEGLAQGSTFFAEWQSEAARLVKSRWSREKAEAFLMELVPDPEKTQKAATIAEKTRDAILARYTNSPNLQNVKGTRYAMLQAVAEYVDFDHRTRVVDDGREDDSQRAELMWLRSVGSHPLKERAHALLTAA